MPCPHEKSRTVGGCVARRFEVKKRDDVFEKRFENRRGIGSEAKGGFRVRFRGRQKRRHRIDVLRVKERFELCGCVCLILFGCGAPEEPQGGIGVCEGEGQLRKCRRDPVHKPHGDDAWEPRRKQDNGVAVFGIREARRADGTP